MFIVIPKVHINNVAMIVLALSDSLGLLAPAVCPGLLFLVC